MLKHRLIACLLWRDGFLIQSKNFKHTNAVGSAMTAIDFFNTWAIDEIVLIDVTRKQDNREMFHRDLVELSKRCFVPLTVGGWVHTIDDVRRFLTEGADKVIVNTSAFRDHAFLSAASKRFGNQCMVVSIDAKRIAPHRYEVCIDRGSTPTGVSPEAWAKEAEQLGAGEIFLTSIDNDGSQNGYDAELIHLVSNTVGIPVIASGGVGEWKHFADGIANGASAVSAANIFHYSDQSTKKAKNYLFEQGIDVRRPEFYDIPLPRRPVYRESSVSGIMTGSV
ncbi:imidazole glycerol phosphate synthase subunit HisF [Candidatus Peregrinibacteria bacterium]|nr:imidazole glycerol phosphate synthase subunit HisF [Candidatus Peregrinibacteria bacterium]